MNWRPSKFKTVYIVNIVCMLVFVISSSLLFWCLAAISRLQVAKDLEVACGSQYRYLCEAEYGYTNVYGEAHVSVIRDTVGYLVENDVHGEEKLITELIKEGPVCTCETKQKVTTLHDLM